MYRETTEFERGAPYTTRDDGTLVLEAHHTFDERRGEVRLRVEAGTLRAIFEEAARALCELTASDCGPATASAPVRVVLRAIDLDSLFADWLNELIYLTETRKEVFPEAHVEQINDQELVATVRGAPPGELHAPVKAATMHDLRVVHEDDKWSASVVLDV